jgi:hypothetical protein
VPIERKQISSVKLNKLFESISLSYNYDPSEYSHELARLVVKWTSDRYIDVYSSPNTAKFSMIKSSEYDKKGCFIYQYCGVYHGRLTHYNDPLIVIKFEADEKPGQYFASLRFIADHDNLFGTVAQKHDRNSMTTIRNKADRHLYHGDDAGH